MALADELDEDVLAIMAKPRCGDEDTKEKADSRRLKRYTYLAQGRWTWKHRLTPYPIEMGFKNFLNNSLTRQQQEAALLEAARIWSTAADLQFRLVGPGEVANIEVTFKPIDGALGDYGEGLSPTPFAVPPTSYIYLDSAENWVLDIRHPKEGLNLVAALTHEMGHTLSLGHSNETAAVMYPTLSLANMRAVLHQDDINGMVSLYGPPRGAPPRAQRSSTPFPTTTTQRPSQSNNAHISHDTLRSHHSPWHIGNVAHRLQQFIHTPRPRRALLRRSALRRNQKNCTDREARRGLCDRKKKRPSNKTKLRRKNRRKTPTKPRKPAKKSKRNQRRNRRRV